MTKTAEKAILPALRPRPALERSGHVARDPAAVEVAFLCLDPLPVDVAGIHARRVEGDVVRDGLVARGRRRVAPGRVLGRTPGDRDGVVARDALPLAEGRTARAPEEPREADVLGREVVGGGLARLQHAERARGLRDDAAVEHDAELAAAPLHARGARIVPHRLLAGAGLDAARGGRHAS